MIWTRTRLEDQWDSKFRYYNGCEYYNEKLATTLTNSKGKTDLYTVTQALNICGQSPRYKHLTLSVVTTPGKSLDININTLTEKGRRHLLKESGDAAGTASISPPGVISDS